MFNSVTYHLKSKTIDLNRIHYIGKHNDPKKRIYTPRASAGF